MNLATVAEYLDLVSDAVTTVATPLAIFAALWGLRTWRHQLKGNIEYELARRYLRGVYRVRDTFKVVRNPMMRLPEEEGAPSGSPVESQKRFRRGQRKEYGRRLQEFQKAWSDLEVEVTEAEVLWGEPAVVWGPLC